MTVKGGTTPACAACKYQRRRCSSDCILSPYFPATEANTFQRVHRLFGVSNVVKLLKQMPTEEYKLRCMQTIIYEANVRAAFPVAGCFGVTLFLDHQISCANQELHNVRLELHKQRLKYRSMAADAATSDGSSSSPSLSHSTDLQLGINNGDTPQEENFLLPPDPILCPKEYKDYINDNETRYGNHYHFHPMYVDQNPTVQSKIPYYDLIKNNNNSSSINNFTIPNAFNDLQNLICCCPPLLDDNDYKNGDSSFASSSKEPQQSTEDVLDGIDELRNGAASMRLDHGKQ